MDLHVLHEQENNEGAILSIKYFKQIVAYSTSKMIRICYHNDPSNFKRRQKICYVSFPEIACPLFPKYFYQKNVHITPSVNMCTSAQKEDFPHARNITIVTSWMNNMRTIELIYEELADRYKTSMIAKTTVDFDNVFIAGSSFFDVEPCKYITFHFDYNDCE